MTLFDNALCEMEALLQCPLCNDVLKQTHTIGECSHHFCRDCIYPLLGVKCRCPTCGLPAIVKNLLRNPSYDTLVACTLKIRNIRAVDEGQLGILDNRDSMTAGSDILAQPPRQHLGTMQGTLLWSYDCGPTFPEAEDEEVAESPFPTDITATSSTFPSVSTVMNRHVRDRQVKEATSTNHTAAAPTIDHQLEASDAEHQTVATAAYVNGPQGEMPSDKIQMLRQMLGMPAWKSAEHLMPDESTQQTRASTVTIDEEERLGTVGTERMPSPELGGFRTYITAAAKGSDELPCTPVDLRESRFNSPSSPEPLPAHSRKRRNLIPPEELDHEGPAATKRSSSTAVTKSRFPSTRIPQQEHSFSALEFSPQGDRQPRPSRPAATLSFLPLKNTAKTLASASREEEETAGTRNIQPPHHKTRVPSVVANHRHIDIDQDIMSRVIDMDDDKHADGQKQTHEPRQQEESEDEHPSLSHDDVWRCEWCRNINLIYIANEPNVVCDHCQRPIANTLQPPPTTSAITDPQIAACSADSVPPSDDEEVTTTATCAQKDVIGSSQQSYEMLGLTMPSRYPHSVMLSVPEAQEEIEANGASSHITRQSAAIPSSSSLSQNRTPGDSQVHEPQNTIGASKLSEPSSNGSQQQQQQQQQDRMACCIFTGLKPEHRHAFDDNTTKLVEADLLMEQITDQDVSDRTTHIVTSVEEDLSSGCLLCPRVLKYMYGMLSPPNVWIVRYEWFENSIYQRQWLPLPAMSEIYEVQGDTQFGPAPHVHERRRRRFQLGKKLFDGCKMFFYGDFTHKSSFRKQDILRLVQYGGATILSRKPPKFTPANTLLTSIGTQSTIGGSSRSGSSTAALRAEAAEYFSPDVSAAGGSGRGDERPFLYVTEDIQPWQVPLDRQQPIIVCDPYSIPGKSVSGASTAVAVAMDRLTLSERKKHGWLTTGGHQAVSATWLLNCISCSLFGKGDMQLLYDGRSIPSSAVGPTGQERLGENVLSSEEMLQELDDAWRQWRSSSQSKRSTV